MSRQICLIHANCQGEDLAPFLLASPEFNDQFEIKHYLNYKKQELAAADLEHCSLFLHQYLAPKWGDYSTEQLLKKVKAKTIIIPNFFFKGYWPFWTNDTNIIEFADSLLEGLLDRGLPFDAVQTLYLRGQDSLIGDVEKIARDSLAKEREKEKATPIKYVDFIEQNWRQKQLFLTINHPGRDLLFLAANSILKILGFSALPESILHNYQHPQDDFWLPIHPAVGNKLQLPFASRTRKYPCFGNMLTHGEYTSHYLACRKYGIADLTGVLKSLAKN